MEKIVEEKDNNGNTHCVRYYSNGVLHRNDGPAVRHTYKDKVRADLFYLNGNLTKQIIYDIDNTPMIIEYYKDNELHREDGPAKTTTVKYSTKEFLKEEKWYYKGKLYRLDGPAVLIETHEKTIKEWWGHNGLTHKEEIKLENN